MVNRGGSRGPQEGRPDPGDPEADPGRWATAPTIAVPSRYRVGRWEVTRPLASGAWGSVYAARRARDTDAAETDAPTGSVPEALTDDAGEFPEDVALKFIPTGTATPRVVAFLTDLLGREVAGHAVLRHDRLVRTFEVLTVDDPEQPAIDGATVLVMERATGSVADLLAAADGSPLPDAKARLRDVVEGLAYMHTAGWVHGDLKPSNILVRSDGSWCLADFGLAGVLEGSHAYVPPLVSPDFAPPERRRTIATVQGQQVRPSGDIWAFGVLACLVLSGRMPLPGETGWARAEAADEYLAGRRELTLVDELPAAWRGLITACLARRPDDRPTSADLQDQLGDLGPSSGWRTRRTRGGRRRLVAAAGAGLVTAGLAGWLTLSPGQRPGTGRADSGAPAATSASSTVRAKPSVPFGACVPRAQEQRDIVTGRLWHRVWYCENDTGAVQYTAPDGKVVIGWIQTTTSWFLCYRRGVRGPGGSDVWYYTQGDEVAAGWRSRYAWGYTPAGYLHLPGHPYPGVPHCPPGT